MPCIATKKHLRCKADWVFFLIKLFYALEDDIRCVAME